MIGQQLSIPELTSLLGRSRYATGTIGEVLVARVMQRSGYQCSMSHQITDIEAKSATHSCKVEVKTSHLGRDNRFKFCLIRDGYTDHRKADFVVLLCLCRANRTVPFVVPVSAIATIKNITIPGDPRAYTGKYAQYRQTMRRLTLEIVS